MTGWARELLYAARALVRTPAFTLTAIAVLALAMGANTAIFSVVEAILLRPLPFREANRLCVLWKSVPARNIEWDWTSLPTIRDWRERSRTLEDLAIVLRPEASKVAIPSPNGPERLQASKVSGNFFELLATHPILGRTFTAGETANFAVISHGFWLSRFAQDPNIIGRTLQLDDGTATVIGVMPPEFEFPDRSTQLWLPLAADSRWPLFLLPKYRIADAFCAVARLRNGVTIHQARAEMTAISDALAAEYPATDRGLGVRIIPLHEQIAGRPIQRALWVLTDAALCLVLIACSNIASLLTARAAARRKELAIRAALGAGRARLVWQLATENIILSLAGGFAGMLLARFSLGSLVALAPAGLPRASGIHLNTAVLLFSFVLCLLTGLAFGLIPSTSLMPLQSRGHRTRGALVAVQIALAITLVSGAGLLIRSFQLLTAVTPGFDTTHLLTVQTELASARYKNEAGIRAFFDEAVQKVNALPGVREAAVGSASITSFAGNAPDESLEIEGQPASQNPERHERDIVSDGYFRAVGIPLLRGRIFSPEDTPNTPPVAVINETMARRLWPSQDPIGRRFKEVLPGLDAKWLTVIGVVAGISLNREGARLPTFYWSVRQWSLPRMSLVVRTATDPATLADSIRKAVQSIDPAIPRFEISTIDQQLAELDRPRRFQTVLLSAFAALALILAAVGLYGLTAYSVEQQTRAIGIRMALGATPSGVVRGMMREGVAWTLAGIASGIAGAAAMSRLLETSLFHIRPTDAPTLATTAALLAFVTAVAIAVPALRAAKVSPAAALRNE